MFFARQGTAKGPMRSIRVGIIGHGRISLSTLIGLLQECLEDIQAQGELFFRDRSSLNRTTVLGDKARDSADVSIFGEHQ
jgi:hypothetical protein